MKNDFKICIFFSTFIQIVEMTIEYNTIRHDVTRATTHFPKITSRTCRLKPDPGPCRGNIPMYYFDPTGGGCQIFKWGGCQGNGNRFDSELECYDTCLTKSDVRATRPRYCQLTYDYGYCFGAVKRWYYDRLWQVCKETIYSGCGGNKNNFYNKEQCDSICRFGVGKKTIESTTKGVKKVVIINPPNTTPARGKNQS